MFRWFMLKDVYCMMSLIVAEKYCTKHLSKKSFSELENKTCFYMFILIRNILPWLWRYGLVSLHLIHHSEQKMAMTWLRWQWRNSGLRNSSYTHSESSVPKRRLHLEEDSCEDNAAASRRREVLISCLQSVGCDWWPLNKQFGNLVPSKYWLNILKPQPGDS